MVYKFVKLKNGMLEYNWMIVLDSIDMLNSFMNIVQKGIIKDGLEILMKKNRIGHSTQQWESAVEIMAAAKNISLIESSCELEIKVYQSRLHSILKYGCMYVNESGGGFPHTDGVEIVDEIIKDKLVFPEYSIKDICVKRWEGGKHYYAKIGNSDVIDKHGNQKWNTKKEAKRQAILFIKEQNNHNG